MPYTHNANTRLYYETVGQGPPLILIPGYGLSGSSWRSQGYVDGLKEHFHVILMDPRGVGRSDKPHDPDDYTSENRVADVTTVLEDLGIKSAHLWGFASGCMTGWHACRLAPQRFRSMVLGGGNPNSQGIDGTPNPMGKDMLERGIEGLVGLYKEAAGGKLPPHLEADLRSQDIEALAAWVMIHRDPHPELFLETLSVPILCYATDQNQPHHDEMREACAVAPDGRFVSLSNSSYADSWFNVEQILPVAVQFMLEIEQRALETNA